jgi:hypothetical protein
MISSRTALWFIVGIVIVKLHLPNGGLILRAAVSALFPDCFRRARRYAVAPPPQLLA